MIIDRFIDRLRNTRKGGIFGQKKMQFKAVWADMIYRMSP